MTENKTQCRECRYFASTKDNLGECHFNPPSVVVVPPPTLPGSGGGGPSHISGAFPTVRQNQWCSKWELKS
jgi:hypothetical protein